MALSCDMHVQLVSCSVRTIERAERAHSWWWLGREGLSRCDRRSFSCCRLTTWRVNFITCQTSKWERQPCETTTHIKVRASTMRDNCKHQSESVNHARQLQTSKWERQPCETLANIKVRVSTMRDNCKQVNEPGLQYELHHNPYLPNLN